MCAEEFARDQHAHNAVFERLWTHTVGITNQALATPKDAPGIDPRSGLPGREEESPGTAVAGFWGCHYFVLTAKHVLDDAQISDIKLFCRPTTALREATASEVTLQDAFVAVSISDLDSTIHRCEWEDIALITVRPDTLSPYLEFADIENAWIDPEEGAYVVGLGYPVSDGIVYSRQMGMLLQNAVLLTPTAFDGEVLPAQTGHYFNNFDADRHYLFPYEPAKQGKHPRGISGAAMWVQSSEQALVWAARFKFAGICTSSYKSGTIEQVVKASTVRQFLKQVYGKTP